MVQIEKDKFVIEMKNFGDGEGLANLQKALIASMVALAEQGASQAPLHTVHLAELLNAVMLTDSQTNVALGKKPYRSDMKNLG